MKEALQSKEIETKAYIHNKEVFIQMLKDRGCMLSEAIHQEDDYYINFEGSFIEFRPQENFLRIRFAKDKYYFTLKRPQKNELDVVEHTTEVSNKKELESILKLLGYSRIVSVHKERMEGVLGLYTVCVDTVDGLGDFVEFEYIGDKDAGEVQKNQKQTLKELGIEESDIVVEGYDTLIYKKQYTVDVHQLGL